MFVLVLEAPNTKTNCVCVCVCVCVTHLAIKVKFIYIAPLNNIRCWQGASQ